MADVDSSVKNEIDTLSIANTRAGWMCVRGGGEDRAKSTFHCSRKLPICPGLPRWHYLASRDEAEALRLYRLAAEKGDANAMNSRALRTGEAPVTCRCEGDLKVQMDLQVLRR
jgi:hypothetical protein